MDVRILRMYGCTYLPMNPTIYVSRYLCYPAPPPPLYVCGYGCMYVCTYVCLYVFVCFCMFLYVFACMYVCMSVCLSVCMYVWGWFLGMGVLSLFPLPPAPLPCGCIISLESNYHTRYLCCPSPPVGWGRWSCFCGVIYVCTYVGW